MVIGVNVQTGQFGRSVGHHLIDVHVGARTRPGLEDVDGELIGEGPGRHLIGGGSNGLGQIAIEPTGGRVDPGRFCLDEREGP